MLRVAFTSLHHSPYGVTILGPRTSPLILPSMLAPNISKLTFTLFMTKSPPKHWLFASSPRKITWPTSLLNPLPHPTSPSCAPSSTPCPLRLACRGVMNQPHSQRNHKTLHANFSYKATTNNLHHQISNYKSILYYFPFCKLSNTCIN